MAVEESQKPKAATKVCVPKKPQKYAERKIKRKKKIETQIKSTADRADKTSSGRKDSKIIFSKGNTAADRFPVERKFGGTQLSEQKPKTEIIKCAEKSETTNLTN